MMHTSPRAITRGLIGSVRADASDPKALAEQLGKAFETFKAEHTDQLNALKKGQEDVVRNEKVDRINQSVGDLQAALEAVNKQVSALIVGPGAGGGKVLKDKDYSDAFLSHFRKGEVKAALDKGVATEGGYLTPLEWDRTITDKLVLISPMRQVCQIQQISTLGYTKVFNSRGTGSGWVGETATRPETTTPALASMTYVTGELYSNPSATQQILDDALIDLEQWLANQVETEFSYQEGLAFISGNGTNKPTGLLTYAVGAANAAAHPFGAVPTTVAASATLVTGDELLGLIYSLPSAFTSNARFIMNRTVQGAIRMLKDTQGRYLWQPAYTAGQPPTLLAFPITEMPGMPVPAANAIPLAFGDFQRGYIIIDRIGMRVLRDPYTNKPYVMFYTTKRVGGGLLDPEPMRFLKMAAS